MRLEPSTSDLITSREHSLSSCDILRPHFNGEPRLELPRTPLNVAGPQVHQLSPGRLRIFDNSDRNPVHTSIVPIVGEVGPDPRYSALS